jgi:hypothetical protein
MDLEIVVPIDYLLVRIGVILRSSPRVRVQNPFTQ